MPDDMPCPFPGHNGRARLVRESEDDLLLECCGSRHRPLGEVRAAIALGRDRGTLTNIALATWTRRLAWEVGAFKPADIQLPSLPSGASPEARLAGEGFALLVGLRWADYERRPVAYSVRFCAAWCGLSRDAAAKAINELHAASVIQPAGSTRGARLFLPGGERA